VDFTAAVDGVSEELDLWSLILPFVGFTPLIPFFSRINGCFFNGALDTPASDTGGVADADGGS
jgi:hypothetical protein